MARSEREERIAHHMDYCTHYDGRATVMKPYMCRAGVKYKTLGETHGQRPCMLGHLHPELVAKCDKWQRTTPEEAAEIADGLDRAYKNAIAGIEVASKWKIKPKPKTDRLGVVECPVCKGKLHLSQSSYNGHVHARCETSECVSFME